MMAALHRYCIGAACSRPWDAGRRHHGVGPQSRHYDSGVMSHAAGGLRHAAVSSTFAVGGRPPVQHVLCRGNSRNTNRANAHTTGEAADAAISIVVTTAVVTTANVATTTTTLADTIVVLVGAGTNNYAPLQ